jgi:hypothetical protein
MYFLDKMRDLRSCQGDFTSEKLDSRILFRVIFYVPRWKNPIGSESIQPADKIRSDYGLRTDLWIISVRIWCDPSFGIRRNLSVGFDRPLLLISSFNKLVPEVNFSDRSKPSIGSTNRIPTGSLWSLVGFRSDPIVGLNLMGYPIVCWILLFTWWTWINYIFFVESCQSLFFLVSSDKRKFEITVAVMENIVVEYVWCLNKSGTSKLPQSSEFIQKIHCLPF